MRVVYASAEPIFLEVDARLMTRVIVNLLANAVRYGAHGSEVHLLTEVMQQSANQNMLVLTITNQVGSPSDASRQTPENKGFGMGLDFIQTVIGKHRGYFKQSISHQEGEQASVQIYLPCLKSELVTEAAVWASVWLSFAISQCLVFYAVLYSVIFTVRKLTPSNVIMRYAKNYSTLSFKPNFLCG